MATTDGSRAVSVSRGDRRRARRTGARSVGLRLQHTLLLVLGVTLLSAGSSARQRADAQDRSALLGATIGLGMKFEQGQPLSDLAMLPELGVRWVRDTVRWHDIEPVAGAFRPFSSAFERRLSFYREHDIGIVFLLAYGNDHAYPPTSDLPHRAVDPQAFARYAAEVARRLKRADVRFVLEVWNEPHNFVLRPLLGGAWHGKPPAPWVDHYVRMVAEVVKRVAAIDPKITVLSDDDMWLLHYRFLEAGLPRALGGFAVHPYSKYAPEIAAVASDTPWVKPFTVVDADRSFASAVRRLREQGRSKLGRAPQVWITEWGWPVGANSPDGPISEARVAAYLPRAYILAHASGVVATCWFSAQDRTDGKLGLTANDGTRRASYFALKTLSSQLAEHELVRQVAGMSHPTSGLQAFLFRRKNRFKLAVWHVAGTPTRVALTGPLRGAAVIDVLGRPATVKEGGDDAFVVAAEAPLYLDGVRGDLLTSEAALSRLLAPATPDDQ
jgi:hypothetical protein